MGKRKRRERDAVRSRNIKTETCSEPNVDEAEYAHMDEPEDSSGTARGDNDQQQLHAGHKNTKTSSRRERPSRLVRFVTERILSPDVQVAARRREESAKHAVATLRRVPSLAQLDKRERGCLTLWKRPVLTSYYFILELWNLLIDSIRSLWLHRRAFGFLVTVALMVSFCYKIPGPHQKTVYYLERKCFWSAYWIGLGILSSVGLGTGLHTFLIYLGPHIASVTLAAYECESLNFPEPPYPDQIICPDAESGGSFAQVNNTTSYLNDDFADSELRSSIEVLATSAVISLWSIMSKVRLEAFMWGTGTALGELPPYFMAKAARVSGEEPDDEEFREFEHLIREQEDYDRNSRTWTDRAKIAMELLVSRGGFLGILICASIPNPLFDLAGITCGYFLVPFWTFFGATLLGKAVIKMHVQKLFVIFSFSEHHAEKVINLLTDIPRIGNSLQEPFKDYLQKQKIKLHRKPGQKFPVKQNWLQRAFESLVFLMVAYFIISIVNSLAQRYHKRMCQKRNAERTLS